MLAVVARIAVVWAVLALAYWGLVGALSLHEALAGLAATLVATGFAAAVQRATDRDLSLEAPYARECLRAFSALIPDSVAVARVLLRACRPGAAGVSGLVVRQPAPAADDAARRGAAILATSLAPNGFVLRDDDARVFHIHKLAGRKP